MNFRRIAGAVATALTLAAGTIALAPSASAATAETAQTCHSTGGGILCVKRITDGESTTVHGAFLNQRTTREVRFVLVCLDNGWHGKEGEYFTSYSGRVSSSAHTFRDLDSPRCLAVISDRNGGWYPTTAV